MMVVLPCAPMCRVEYLMFKSSLVEIFEAFREIVELREPAIAEEKVFTLLLVKVI